MGRAIKLLGAAIMFTACSPQQADYQPGASANGAAKTPAGHFPDLTGWPIVDGKTKQVGVVTTRLETQGVFVTVDTRGLPPGLHGVHIHQNAKCEAPDFTSAGAHWNFKNKKHGHKNPAGYHAGDLGNLQVAADGSGLARFLVKKEDWDPQQVGGLSIVIHAAADDERTDPSGNSGERIACGLLYLRRD